jgi:hypothetical protein
VVVAVEALVDLGAGEDSQVAVGDRAGEITTLPVTRYPLSVIRYPLSVIRYPLLVIRYPLPVSVTRYSCRCACAIDCYQ